jgi:hypothetical protein
MLCTLSTDNHRELLRARLEDLINPNHELALLSRKIGWNYWRDERGIQIDAFMAATAWSWEKILCCRIKRGVFRMEYIKVQVRCDNQKTL